MKSAMKWKAINNQIMQWKAINRADKANLPNLQSIPGYELLFKVLKFSSSASHGGWHFFRVFFVRGHWVSNLNPEICRGLEIIIAFGEDSIGPKHSYWRVITTQSCNFDRSQYRKFRMGYDYEIGQQVYLLVQTPLDTSCQLLVA